MMKEINQSVEDFCISLEPMTNALIDKARDRGWIEPKKHFSFIGDNELLRQVAPMLLSRGIICIGLTLFAIYPTALLSVAAMVAALYIAMDFARIVLSAHLAEKTIGKGLSGAAALRILADVSVEKIASLVWHEKSQLKCSKIK